MLVLSLDGKKETHDAMRPFPNKAGSYDAAVRGFKKVIDSREGKNYYLRGTYTHFSTHFCEDVLDMTKVGKEISVEPVVGIDEPWVLTEEDLPVIFDEYDKLARAYLERRREGNPFDFFHFNVALDNGPCVAKRLAGCGAGHEYYCITADGDIYPCHQFVGREQYKMGTLDTGIVTPEMVQKFRHTHVLTKPECSKCWARFFCSGGCHANADLINGDITSRMSMDVACKRNVWRMLSLFRLFCLQKHRKARTCVRISTTSLTKNNRWFLVRSAKAERIFTFSSIIVKNAGKKQAGNLLLRKKKISKIFREKVIFLRKICRFSVENLTFFELFQEILMPKKAIIKHSCFSTNPSVSRKNVKKVTKKVLT